MVKETRYIIIVVDRCGSHRAACENQIKNAIDNLDFMEVEMIQKIETPVLET